MKWRAIIFAAALGVLALVNHLMLWLPPLTFTAVAVAVPLVVVAPRPAALTLAISGVVAFAVRSEMSMVAQQPMSGCPNDGKSLCIVTITTGTNGAAAETATSTGIGWYTGEEKFYSPDVTSFFLEHPVVPAWFVVAGVLGWAIRRLSWRTAVAASLYGAAVWAAPEQAPVVLFAAAAAAIGPRRDVHYLAGLGVLALAWTDQQHGWSPIALIVTLTVALGLGVWALAKKNSVNAAVALVSLAVAPLTPFLSAGVLLAYVVIRRTAGRSAGTSSLQPAE